MPSPYEMPLSAYDAAVAAEVADLSGRSARAAGQARVRDAFLGSVGRTVAASNLACRPAMIVSTPNLK